MRYKGAMGRRGWKHALFVLAVMSPACTEKTDADYRADVDVAVHGSIGDSIAELVQATRDLQAASPARVWRPATTDAAAITAMRAAWKRTRFAYEQIEGAIKAVFPTLDAAMDARYEESLAALGGGGDRNPFDGRGVTGMHAIERILFAPVTRPEVITYECNLPGYKPAAYPSTDDEAIAFKTGLVQRLIDDGDSLGKQWRKAEIDLDAAYRGQVGMMIEQQDKVNLAVTGEEESRYANITLADLRNNLDGTQNIYDLFRDWIHSKAAGGSSDSKIQARFDELATIYLAGDALPDVPPGWAADHPTPENLATPFGMMWQTIHESVDPGNESSVVFELNQIASLLGLPGPPRP
jgi:iron uptake system component EfeO